MANTVPAGSDVSAGTYQCTNCGNQIEVVQPSICRPVQSAAKVNGRQSAAPTAPKTRTRIRTKAPSAGGGRPAISPNALAP
jgi:hypothetical protein